MSPDPKDEPGRPGRDRRLRLRDLAALVLGYGLASVLVRAYWPNPRLPEGLALVALAVGYAWLGLAMTGPFVVPLLPATGGRWPRTTWAENTWAGIGAYWIGLLAFGVVTRLSVQPLVFAGSASGLMIVGAFWNARNRRESRPAGRWTEPVALGLLATWPAAWAVMAYLASTLG
jgi:hypothetical protein